MFKREIFAVLFCTLLMPMLVIAGGDALQPKDEVPAIEEAPLGGDFTLQSVAGPVSLKDLHGKVVLLYFGYTKCPDVCPTSLSFMTQALNEMTDDELAKVQGVFVSVDPKRDTVESLKEYVEYFHPNFSRYYRKLSRRWPRWLHCMGPNTTRWRWKDQLLVTLLTTPP